MSEITPGQVQTLPEPVCPECGEPRPSCVCEVGCDVCGKLSSTVAWCPVCLCNHCSGCIVEEYTACPGTLGVQLEVEE